MLGTSHRASEGWYADPSGRLLMRYWNGTEWTLETRGNDAWANPENHTPANPALAEPEVGWAGIAFALHSAMVHGQPVTVNITLPNQSVITVRTIDHVYSWADETAALPEQVSASGVTFMPSTLPSTAQDRSLDGLLWRISAKAFPNQLAPWLQSDDLYRMQRWPNLTTINPELDDMRQAAMLANGMFTIDELAGFSDRSIPATRSLINALSLMNTLKIATPRDTGAFLPTQYLPAHGTASAATHEFPSQPPLLRETMRRAAPQKSGLFHRLRKRLGL